MSGFDDDSDGIGEETPIESTVRFKAGFRGRVMALAMFDSDRITLYSTMAGLIEGGFTLSEAADLLSSEYETVGMEEHSSSVSIFFAAVEAARALKAAGDEEEVRDGIEGVRAAAYEAFGDKFVGAEEMALLKSLVRAPRPEGILNSLSKLVSRYEEARLQNAAVPARRFAS